MNRSLAVRFLIAAFAVALLGAPASASRVMRFPHLRGTGSPIQHVIFIVQENRSFNNLFNGYPGALTQNFGFDENGVRIRLHAQSLAQGWDIDHTSNGFFAAYDKGKLDGWNTENVCCGSKIPGNPAYAYATKAQVKTYWQMASQYVLADHAFQSNLDGSFIAHQFVVAAYASHGVNFPISAWGCQGGPSDTVATLNANRTIGPRIPACFDNLTLGDELDQAGLSWRFYASTPSGNGGIWSSYQAVNHIVNGPDWNTDVISPSTQFITDVQNDHLAAVTWITPTWPNSDHAGSGSTLGPSWVASLVNAVGQSQFWNSSAIFVVWDDWGGWFDPVKPVFKDYDGLGFRIPMLIVSPYALQGVVAHKQYETTSVLKFIENTFGLASLAASDKRARDPSAEAFNFNQSPRPFTAFAEGRPLQFWRTQPDTEPPHEMVGGD